MGNSASNDDETNHNTQNNDDDDDTNDNNGKHNQHRFVQHNSDHSNLDQFDGIETLGYRVLGVQPNSPASQAGLVSFFDFLVGANQQMLLGSGENLQEGEEYDDVDFPALLEEFKGKPLELLVWNIKCQQKRLVSIVPNDDWGGAGLLGVTIRLDNYAGAEDRLIRILNVEPHSPADIAGLVSEQDYMLGTTAYSFDSTTILAKVLQMNIDHVVELYVYNTDSDKVRVVALMPTWSWGGNGLLGAEVGTGYLHRLPNACKNTIGESVERKVRWIATASDGGGGGGGGSTDSTSAAHAGSGTAVTNGINSQVELEPQLEMEASVGSLDDVSFSSSASPQQHQQYHHSDYQGQQGHFPDQQQHHIASTPEKNMSAADSHSMVTTAEGTNDNNTNPQQHHQQEPQQQQHQQQQQINAGREEVTVETVTEETTENNAFKQTKPPTNNAAQLLFSSSSPAEAYFSSTPSKDNNNGGALPEQQQEETTTDATSSGAAFPGPPLSSPNSNTPSTVDVQVRLAPSPPPSPSHKMMNNNNGDTMENTQQQQQQQQHLTTTETLAPVPSSSTSFVPPPPKMSYTSS